VSLLPVNMIRNDAHAEEIAPKLASQVAAGEIRLGVELFGLAHIGEALARLRAGRLSGRAAVMPGE
jgi:hypothetical protein